MIWIILGVVLVVSFVAYATKKIIDYSNEMEDILREEFENKEE